MFLQILANKWVLPMYIVSDCEYTQNFVDALTLWRHTKTDGTFFLVSMEREDP